MPQSSFVVAQHAPFFAPLCGWFVSDFASIRRNGVSEIHPGAPSAGGVYCSKLHLSSRFLNTTTLSNEDVFRTPVSWLVTARPTRACGPVAIGAKPICVHALLSSSYR